MKHIKLYEDTSWFSDKEYDAGIGIIESFISTLLSDYYSFPHSIDKTFGWQTIGLKVSDIRKDELGNTLYKIAKTDNSYVFELKLDYEEGRIILSELYDKKVLRELTKINADLVNKYILSVIDSDITNNNLEIFN